MQIFMWYSYDISMVILSLGNICYSQLCILSCAHNANTLPLFRFGSISNLEESSAFPVGYFKTLGNKLFIIKWQRYAKTTRLSKN